MKNFRVALTAALAAVTLLAGTAAAFASPGQVTSKVNIRSGPGGQYDVIGVIREGSMIDVAQCQAGYCYVSGQGGTGWISASYIAQPGQQQPDPSLNLGIQIGPDGKPNINFGINQPQPQPQPQPPRPPQPQPIPLPQPDPDDEDIAQACFYTGTNFTGSSFCVEQGDTLNFVGRNWDNRVRSVEVFNGATVDICAERNLVGTCQTLTRDKSRLTSRLDRNVSSVDVY